MNIKAIKNILKIKIADLLLEISNLGFVVDENAMALDLNIGKELINKKYPDYQVCEKCQVIVLKKNLEKHKA